MHIYKVNGFTPVRSHLSHHAGQTWCLLHEGYQLPDGFFEFPPDVASFLHGGLQLAAANMPVPWDLASPWLPWQPKAGAQWKPWYLDTDTNLPSQREWETEMESLQICVDAFREHHPEYRGPLPSRSALDFSSHQAPQEIRRAVLERVCFVNWWMTWMPDWRSASGNMLKRSLQSTMEAYLQQDQPKVGVVIELAKDWTSINLPLWIRHGIPVYYQWNGDAELDRRFAHVSPASLQANTCGGACGYDGFFQDLTMSLPSQPRRNLASKGHAVIDFEGWKCRSILEKRVANRYFCRLPFIIQEGRAGKFVVFSRWRATRKCSGPYSDSDSEDCSDRDSEAEGSPEDLNRIRETYRWLCSPHSGKTYDIETGKQIDQETLAPRQLRRDDQCSSSSTRSYIRGSGSHTRPFTPPVTPHGTRAHRNLATSYGSEPRGSNFRNAFHGMPPLTSAKPWSQHRDLPKLNPSSSSSSLHSRNGGRESCIAHPPSVPRQSQLQLVCRGNGLRSATSSEVANPGRPNQQSRPRVDAFSGPSQLTNECLQDNEAQAPYTEMTPCSGKALPPPSSPLLQTDTVSKPLAFATIAPCSAQARVTTADVLPRITLKDYISRKKQQQDNKAQAQMTPCSGKALLPPSSPLLQTDTVSKVLAFAAIPAEVPGTGNHHLALEPDYDQAVPHPAVPGSSKDQTCRIYSSDPSANMSESYVCSLNSENDASTTAANPSTTMKLLPEVATENLNDVCQ